jgi:hypothetical protein
MMVSSGCLRCRVGHLLLILLSCYAVSVLAHEAETCNGIQEEGECGLSEDDREALVGLNALPARIAVVSGQVPDLKMCGEWCQGILEENPGTPCRMDPTLVPCQGDFYCTTTCALWHRLIVMDPRNGFAASKGQTDRPTTTCAMFRRFASYSSTKKSSVCDPSCLLPEIRVNRYANPTGFGLMCEKGTCYPGAGVANTAPTKLQCPCNYFGSSCDDDDVPITSIQHTAVLGQNLSTALTATTITVPQRDWSTIMANHQPGGVIRIVQRFPDGRTHEQPYAIASASSQDATIEILTAPPDQTLDLVTRAVAERIRAFPVATITLNPPNLHVNPSIVGFFNSQWQFLLQAMETMSIEHVILLSTGAGLSGSLSVLDRVLHLNDKEGSNNNKQSSMKSVHLYHGVRTVDELPYQDLLHKRTEDHGEFEFIIVESQERSENDQFLLKAGIRRAVATGNKAKRRILENTDKNQQGKIYVQHVLQDSLADRSFPGATLEKTVFIVCGRLALLEDSKAMLERTFCSSGGEADNNDDCHDQLGQRFFTNI